MNDVVLAALAGALGGYDRGRGDDLDALECLVPMNLCAGGSCARDALPGWREGGELELGLLEKSVRP